MREKNQAFALISCVVSRLLLPIRSVAFTHPYLGWLGFEFKAVAAALRLKGFEAFAVPAPSKLTTPISERACPAILRDALRYVVAIEAEEANPNIDVDHPSLVKLWSARLADMLDETEAMLRGKCPKLVVLVQGYEPINAVARAAALNLGIPVLAVENTAISSRMLWDNISAITTNRNLASNYYWRYAGSNSDDIVNPFVDSLISGLRGSKSTEHSAPVGAVPPRCSRPDVLFLGQVYTDSSLVFGLRGWRSPLDVIAATVQWCQRNGYRLILKLHPKESMGNTPITNQPYNQLTYRKLKERRDILAALAANQSVIDVDNRYDTYALIAQSDFAVTINSQAGLEATLFGKPVVICGDAFYQNHGFTLDVTHPAQFDLMMDQATRYSVESAAREFAYIFYERYCRPKSVDALVNLVLEQMEPRR